MDHNHRINWLSRNGSGSHREPESRYSIENEAPRGRTDQDLSRLLRGNVERGLREVPVEWLRVGGDADRLSEFS
jgi:hypothetical protein